MPKNTIIEPVDGAGGFDNVAPRLSVEEGPGGLEWDPSPTYRTRYKGGQDYLAGANQPQGNNWFSRIPSCVYVAPPTDQFRMCCDANNFRVYTLVSGTIYAGRFGNCNSKLVKGTPDKLYDTRGKTCTMDSSGRPTALQGLNGARLEFTFGPSSVTILQKPDATAGSEVRRITSYIVSNRYDRVEVEEKVSGSWSLCRKINFTYHEDVSGAVEGTTGDLIRIEDEKLLSPSNTWSNQTWVYKYYTGTYNSSTNPGYPCQVKAVIGPESYAQFVKDNPTLNIHTRTADQLESPVNYLDRRYKYFSDKRLRDLDLKSSCGCGGGEGLYTYSWDVNTEPTDFNTWYHRVTITFPSANGSSRIIDYNKYGQTLNWIAQEVAGNPSSRRWIQTSTRDSSGRLTESFSAKACTSYNDSTHVVTTNSTAGQRFQFSYDANSALTTVKLRNPSNGNLLYQMKKAFALVTSGDRRRLILTSSTVYPTETTTDTGGLTTTFSYTYHTADPLAVKIRTTTFPAIATTENGSGSSVVLKDYFEPEGLHTWTKDGDGFVHYTGFDASRHMVTKRVVNLNTSNPPTGVPSPPDPVFNTTSGLNLVTDMEYDALRRLTKQVAPDFVDNAGATVNITKRIWYTRLYGGELVTLEYPHVGASYYHAAITLTVKDREGHLLTRALGELNVPYRDTNLADDFDPNQSSIEVGFHGVIVRRSDFIFDGDKVSQEDMWIDADGLNQPSNKYSTYHTYDASGRRLTTKNTVGTITRWSYDVLNRRKTTKIGTVDGGGGDNMTLVEELFYDDEEDTATNVGDGNLTRAKRYEDGSVARTTDNTFDYRQRLTQVDHPGSVRKTQTFTNRNQVSVSETYDTSAGSVLMAKTENFFDAWGQLYETREHGVTGGVASGYTSVRTWRNGRGQFIKDLSRGKVFKKTQYDGAGRVTNQAVSYDTAESTYAAASNLTGDTVIQETRYTLDKLGGATLVGTYERRHDGTGTGGLTVGSTGNGRAQYVATWHDTLHRTTDTVNYGTHGGVDMTDRPAGNPPSTSSSSSLLSKKTYTIKSEVLQATDPQGIITQTEYDNPGRLVTRIENYVDGTPGPGTDQDRKTEFTYNGNNQVVTTTAWASGANEVTENVFGVTKGASFPDSKIASYDLLKLIKYPDPATGQPSTNAVDQESFAYNAQGERIWRKDQQSTQHTLDYDARGRLIHDRVNVLGTGIEGAIRRISTTYDAIDRPVKVSSYNDPAVGFGTVQNEVQYEYSRYNTISKLYQEWAGAVNTGTSRKVQYAYSFPTDGTTAVRRTSTTYTDGTTVIDDIYNSGTDDIISRLSGQQRAGLSLFQESYLGLGRLVKRQFSVTNQPQWTLIGTDTGNNDNYVGLDRFGRIDDLVVKTSLPLETFNRYTYAYNFNSQVTFREDHVGNVGGVTEFDETFAYDGLGRLTKHQRGFWDTTQMKMQPLRLHECWTLDPSGNPSPYFNGASETCGSTYTASYNHSNEISSWSLGSVAHNDAGDLTTKGNYTFIYDAWNRLKEVQVLLISVAQYQYNGLGQKIVSALTSPARYYYYSDRWQILEERDADTGAVLQNYVWGTQYIDDLAVVNASSPAPVAVDANFNVVTRFGSGGPVSSRIVYDGYGKPKQLSPDWSTFQTITEDLHLFTGRLYVKQHEQYDFRRRTQDPQLARFVQRDPIGIWGEPSSFGNTYTYASNDPVNKVDPMGKRPTIGLLPGLILASGMDCASAPQIHLSAWGDGIDKDSHTAYENAKKDANSQISDECLVYCRRPCPPPSLTGFVFNAAPICAALISAFQPIAGGGNQATLPTGEWVWDVNVLWTADCSCTCEGSAFINSGQGGWGPMH